MTGCLDEFQVEMVTVGFLRDLGYDFTTRPKPRAKNWQHAIERPKQRFDITD